MPSQLYVQVPVGYGDFSRAAPGSPMHHLLRYGHDALTLLQIHMRLVLYSREQRMDGVFAEGVAEFAALPASQRIARRDLGRLADAGLIEPREDGGYFVPAAVEWPIVRTGVRDPIPGHIRKMVYARDGYCCVRCGSPDGLTLDHIVPWSQYGPDESGNLQTLCGSCNSAKGARV